MAAGWAIDLFLGRQTRPHGDLEITVPASRFAEVGARFPEFDFYVPQQGALSPVTPELFKAKGPGDKDEADFAAALPRLDATRRRWLDGALALVHPEHPWRAALSRPPAR